MPSKPKPPTCEEIRMQEVINNVLIAEGLGERSADIGGKIYVELADHLPIYEDVYDQLADRIENYVQRPYRPEAPFPASVVESFNMLMDHWEETGRPKIKEVQLQHWTECEPTEKGYYWVKHVVLGIVPVKVIFVEGHLHVCMRNLAGYEGIGVVRHLISEWSIQPFFVPEELLDA